MPEILKKMLSLQITNGPKIGAGANAMKTFNLRIEILRILKNDALQLNT